MNKLMKLVVVACCLCAAGAARADGVDVGNFLWNGGFEDSAVYWGNGIRMQPFGNYVEGNCREAWISFWYGLGNPSGDFGVSDKKTFTAGGTTAADQSLCVGNRFVTVYGGTGSNQKVLQTVDLPFDGSYTVSFLYCNRNVDTLHKVIVTLAPESGDPVLSETLTAAKTTQTFSRKINSVTKGRYTISFAGTVDGTCTCFDEVSIVFNGYTEALPVGLVHIDPLCVDRQRMLVRVLDYGQNEALTKAEYALAKKGEAFGDWVVLSETLAKESVATNVLTGLEADADYDLKVRLTAATSDARIVETSFNTGCELIQNGGFEDFPSIKYTNSPVSLNVSDEPAGCWAGTGEAFNHAKAYNNGTPNGGSPATSDSGKYPFIQDNAYGLIWQDKALQQAISVPVAGLYELKYKYCPNAIFTAANQQTIHAEILSADGQTVTQQLLDTTVTSANKDGAVASVRMYLLPGEPIVRLRGELPQGESAGLATCVDDVSLVLCGKGVLPVVESCEFTDVSTEKATLSVEFSSPGGTFPPVDISIAFAPAGMQLPAFEVLESEISADGQYRAVIAGLEQNTTYDYCVRVRNAEGEEKTIPGSFKTVNGVCAGNLIGNPGFEESQMMISGKATGDFYCNENGVWPATTTVWKVSADKSVYSHGVSIKSINASDGISKFSVLPSNFVWTDEDHFRVGTYSAYIWKTGSFEQDLVVPAAGTYRLNFRYGQALHKPDGKFNLRVAIQQGGAETTVFTDDGVVYNSDGIWKTVPDTATVALAAGPATFKLSQVTVADTGLGCYDEILLYPLSALKVVSQNPDVTGGVSTGYGMWQGLADGARRIVKAESVWTDAATGDKYTCTGWKLYRNGVLEKQEASLKCVYVHTAGDQSRVVFGWKPWAASDVPLKSGGFVVIFK